MEPTVKLLPLTSEPLVAPTDRDMLPSERREFVRTHRTCVFGYERRAHGPSMSIVYYIPSDDDELLISTMAGRAKAKAIARTGKVSICILDERWPFAYLQVYCDARIDTDPDLVVDVMMAVAGRMSGQTLAKEARPAIAAMAKKENRVVVRCRPYSTFAQPPRHLYRNDQEERVTHWITAAMPWDASDSPATRGNGGDKFAASSADRGHGE
jgi:PPOX class probable F420-dependent enzyme